ncbi:hypothetical protein GmRootV15_68420 (plasmid) [Variovorax sp. V15]
MANAPCWDLSRVEWSVLTLDPDSASTAEFEDAVRVLAVKPARPSRCQAPAPSAQRPWNRALASWDSVVAVSARTPTRMADSSI